MILSGSQAELQSLLISGPGIDTYGVVTDPLVISLEVLSNDIRLRDLPTSDPNIPGALWKHLPNTYAQSAVVMVSSASQSPGGIIRIPFNTANLDHNGDGTITTLDLVEFLSVFGEDIDSVSAAMFDTDMDGEIGSADLLDLLAMFGSSSPWTDNRPVIDWCSIEEWIDDNGNITPASVTDYFAEVAEAGGNIWQILPHGTEVSNNGTPVDNVYNYIAQTMTPSLETFLYIYFGQSTGGVWGGHDDYHRDSISCSG